MTVLLDIGARNGESLEEFIRWPQLSEIHAFEPMPGPFANLCKIEDPRVRFHNAGLSDVTAKRIMYGSDHLGEASIFETKVDLDPSVTTTCLFVEASVWFAEMIHAPCIVKMNCEGSEVAILHNLMDSGEITKIRALRFEMDISRVPDHAHEADILLARLDSMKVPYVLSSDARLVNGQLVERIPRQEVAHHDRLHAWLATCLT